MSTLWPKFEEVVKAPVQTKVTKTLWPKFDEVVKTTPILNKAGIDVSGHAFNPLNPNNQLNASAPTASLAKNFLSSLGGATKEVGSLVGGKKSLPAMIAQPIINPSQNEQAIEKSLPKSPLNFLAKPIIRVLTPTVEGLGENFADILFSKEEAKNLNKQSIQTVGKQAQAILQTASTKNLTAEEKLNVVLNSANFSLSIVGVVTDALRATGNKLATTNSFVKVSPADIRTVLKSEKPMPTQARTILETLADNNQGFEMKLQRPSGGVKQTVGEAIGGKATRSTNIKATGDVKAKLNAPNRVVPIKEQPLQIPEIKTSKLAGGVEQSAIEAGLTRGFEGKPEYAVVNVKDQARAASNLLQLDPQKARSIAMGHELPPEGILPESVFVAVEQQAIKDGDVQTLRELATSSNLTTEATGIGQRIRMLAERDPNSPVTSIRKVAEAREQAVIKKQGTKAKENVKLEIKKDIEKLAPKADVWTKFIDEIKCT